MQRLMILLLLTAQSPLQRSQVHVDGRFRDGPVDDYVMHFCNEATLTPAQFVRKYYAYHRVTPMQIHGSYSYLVCGVKGTMTMNEKTFYWKLFIGNVMQTNYPDGEDHFRAGKPDPQE